MKLRDYLFMVPACNPSEFTYMGTNCYVVGQGRMRALIDLGNPKPHSGLFIEKLRSFVNETKTGIDRIFFTHSHFDHIGGIEEVTQTLTEANQMLDPAQPAPRLFKRLDGCQTETEALEQVPGIVVENLQDQQVFDLGDGLTMTCLFTPGHITDHVSYLVSTGSENVLVSGDIILGAPSTTVQDLSVYMKTLYSLRDRYQIDQVCVPHSVDLSSTEFVMMPWRQKVDSYIKYREDREKVLLQVLEDPTQFADVARDSGYQGQLEDGCVSFDFLYSVIYGPRKLEGRLALAGQSNLRINMKKLVDDGLVQNCDGDSFKLVHSPKI